MTSFKGCHPYSNVPSFSRHEQRLVRQPNVHHSEISNPSLFPKTQWRPAMSLRRECSRETREIHEKKSAFIHALLPNLRIQQEVTEKTEDRVRPRSLRCLLFKPLGVARRRTTQAQRRRPRGAPIATATARRRSLQRMVRPVFHSKNKRSALVVTPSARVPSCRCM